MRHFMHRVAPALTRALALLGVFLAVPSHAAAETVAFPTGRLPIAVEPAAPLAFAPADRLVIEGRIAAAPATIVLRIDDLPAPAYAERMNDERELPPGPFRIELHAANFKTTGGRPLDLASLHRIVLFATDPAAIVTVSRFARLVAASPTTAPPSSAAGPAISLGTGTAPISFAASGPLDGRARQFVIEGANTAAAPTNMVLRIDDGEASSYATRVNVERELPPGPFRLTVPVEGLTTPSKRVLDASNIRLVILTPWPESGALRIDRFDLAPIASLPEGAQGFALGAPDAPLPAGFERLAPGDPRLDGRSLTVRRRPMPDPLTANGITGVEAITLRTTPGRKRVTVWAEDPGEWEHLPAVLARTIEINGRRLSRVERSPAAWLAERYLRLTGHEHAPDSDAWHAYGRLRGDRHSLVVDAPDGVVRIRLDAQTPADAHVSAVLIEPAESRAGLDKVIAGRAAWYAENFPPDHTNRTGLPDAHAGREIAFDLPPAGTAEAPPVPLRLAPGTGTRLTLAITAAIPIGAPEISLAPPALPDGGRLRLAAWAGQWRLERVEPADTRLTWRDDRLLADTRRLPLGPGTVRRYELWLTAPPGTAPGRYTGAVTIGAGSNGPRLVVPLMADVLDVRLPPAPKPAGPYLAYAPHLTWHATPRTERDRQARCDLDALAAFGLTGTAPPVATPLSGGLAPFLAEMERAHAAGLAPGWLLYDPLHQMRLAVGAARAAKFAGAATDALAAKGRPLPVWSAADEPSNPDQNQGDLGAWVGALRAATRHPIRLAGHLNAAHDRAFADLFDIAIINPGFGIDRNQVAQLSRSGRTVWFYNTAAPRLTAGVWLHHSAAERYVQWHARMPTADPLDPIDGREGDVQMFYPMTEVCPARPDIHRNLLRLAEGVVDQRWLAWLAARPTDAARRLASAIEAEIPDAWGRGRDIGPADLEAIRGRIMDFAAARGQ